MKAIETYKVIVYGTGMRTSNCAIYAFKVGAKTPKEAEEITKGWLKENGLTARTRTPRTLCLLSETGDFTQMEYRQIERIVYPTSTQLNY